MSRFILVECLDQSKCAYYKRPSALRRDRADGGENVTESANFQNHVPLETSIPGASLESILCTQELRNRPSRSPEHETENRALVALATALAESPRTILQSLAGTIVEVNRSYSSGVSLFTRRQYHAH
jgi:hypothetical protein